MIPKKIHRQTVMEGGANEAAADADDDMLNSDSDSDVDASTHDFTSDGVLPEAITSLHLVKKPQERAAQLAVDYHEVRSVVGMADIQARYPKDSNLLLHRGLRE